MRALVNLPEKVILHCSASPDRGDFIGVRQIDQWHKEKGWSGVGYHFVIRRTGVIEEGRKIHQEGAHTRGHNDKSIGVCWVGTWLPTDQQIRSILSLYIGLLKSHGITADHWHGHYEFNPAKTCPGFSMNMFRTLLREYHSRISHGIRC